jgi:hypothetical protein
MNRGSFIGICCEFAKLKTPPISREPHMDAHSHVPCVISACTRKWDLILAEIISIEIRLLFGCYSYMFESTYAILS